MKAHICIQQTAIELVELGYEVHVLADGVTSIHHKGEVPVALDRMRQAGVYVTTSESFLFTYMGMSVYFAHLDPFLFSRRSGLRLALSLGSRISHKCRGSASSSGLT